MAQTPKAPKIDRTTLALANPGLAEERIEALAQVYEGFEALRRTLEATMPADKMTAIRPSFDGMLRLVEMQMRN